MESREEEAQMEVTEGEKICGYYSRVKQANIPLPRQWSSKDKYSYIGLSQNNLRVHYKGQ